MLIVCPNCATSYDVDVASLGPDGRRVRCVRCRSVWQAELPHKDKLIAAAEALAPVRRAVEAVAEAAAGDAAAQAALPPPPELAPEQIAIAAEEARAESVARQAIAEPFASSESAESADVSNAAGDAAFEVDSPPIAPPEPDIDLPPVEAEADLQPVPNDEPLEDIESVAGRRYRQRTKRDRWRWPLSRLQSGILALIVINAIVVGWRSDFVRAMPQTASFYAWLGLPVNLRGFDFEGLTTTTELHEGVPILVVGGKIVNVTSKTETVPHLRFAVRNAARQEIYSWSAVPPRGALGPGEAAAFQTRLASPPPDSHDVLIRFVNRYDILAGTH